MNIDLSKISKILTDGVFDEELDYDLRKQILDDIPDQHYDIACDVFNAARKAYFELGLTIWGNVIIANINEKH